MLIHSDYMKRLNLAQSQLFQDTKKFGKYSCLPTELYFDQLFGSTPLITIDNWSDLDQLMNQLLNDYNQLEKKT